MANKKMTKKDYFNMLKAIPAVAANDALVQFIDHEVELLSKKNASDRKPTEKQTANAAIARKVVALMVANPTTLYTVTELEKKIDGLPEDMTNQRMSAIVRSLLPEVGTGEVERIEDKRKVFFRLNPNGPAAVEVED